MKITLRKNMRFALPAATFFLAVLLLAVQVCYASNNDDDGADLIAFNLPRNTAATAQQAPKQMPAWPSLPGASQPPSQAETQPQPAQPPSVKEAPAEAPPVQEQVQPQPQPVQQLQPEPVPEKGAAVPSPETPPVQQPVQLQPPVQQVTPPGKPARVTTGRRGEVSFNFDDADVFSVIQTIFGEVLRVNYVIDPRVKGRVNFRSVNPVAKDDVLPLMEVILRLNGIGVVEEAGLYRIVPIGDLPKEPAAVGIGRDTAAVSLQGKGLLQIVPVNYITSSDLVRILTPFLSANAVIVDVPKSNHIIIVDTDANVKKLLSLVEIFDSEKLKKTKPQVFVYPVQNTKAKDLASMLQQIFLGSKASAPAASAPRSSTATPAPGAARTPGAPEQAGAQTHSQTSTVQLGGEPLVSDMTRIIADDVQNSLIILASPEDYILINETIRRIDVVPRQVMIEAVVAAVELTDNMRFGLAWRIQNDFTISGLKPFTRDINIEGPLDFASKIANPTLTFTAFDNSGNVKLLLQALADENKAKILSSPHILVSDNREARIQVGDQIPIATSTTSTPLAGGATPTNTTTSTIQYKDTGTILKVKPQVNDSGLVALELTQEVSKGKTINVLGTEQFQITKKEITTNLVAQDGQTIVIGGLIDEVVAKGRSGIPFLGKLPLLGYLFGSTVDDYIRAELVILLTPHVVKNQKEAAATSSDYLDRFRDNTKLKMEEIIQGKKQ